MKKLFVQIVRKLSAFAWQQEINSSNGIAKLVEMHATPGAFELAIETDPALKQYIAMCFAEMVAASPNYTEAKFDFVAKHATKDWQWITVTVLKSQGKTPHQLRMEAEAELAKYKKDWDWMETIIVHAFVHSGYSDCGFMQMTTPQKMAVCAILHRNGMFETANRLKQFIAE